MSRTELGFDLLVEGKYRLRMEKRIGEIEADDQSIIVSISKGKGAFKGKTAITYRTPVMTTNVPSTIFGLPAAAKSKGKYEKKVEGEKTARKGGKKDSAEK